jgi:predicted ATPase
VPDAIYIFKHALVRDTAYQSLLKSRRRVIHGRIAEILAQDESGQSALELIAHHFTEAGLPDRAVPYWRQAGQRSLERSANSEAISQFKRGMILLDSMPEDAERYNQRLSFLLSLGISVQTARTAGAPEVKRIYSEARDLAQQTGNPSKQFAAIWGLWRHRRMQFDLTGAKRLANQLLDIAQTQDDPVFQLQAHHALWTTLLCTGEFSDAKKHVVKGEALYDREKHRTQALYYGGHDPSVCGLGTMATIKWIQGNPNQATSWNDQAVSLARDLDHPISLAHALGEEMSIYLFRREPEAVMERVEVLVPLAEEWEVAEFKARSEFCLGWAEVEMGKYDQGIRRMQSVVEARRSTGIAVEESHWSAVLIESLIKAERSEEGLKLVDAAVAATEMAGAEYWMADLLRLKGELLFHTLPDDSAAGEAQLVQAIKKAHRQGAKMFELRAATSLARQLSARARNAEAHDLLAPIYNSFTEGFGTPDLTDAKALMDQLS